MAKYLVSKIGEQVQKSKKCVYYNQIHHYITYSSVKIANLPVRFLTLPIFTGFDTEMPQIYHQEKTNDAGPAMEMVWY